MLIPIVPAILLTLLRLLPDRYDSVELNETPPDQPVYERLVRNILADRPRVTRYQIDWSMPIVQTP
jgi:hypothetical protein